MAPPTTAGLRSPASCWVRLAVVVGFAFIAIWTTVWKDVRGGDYIDCTQKAGSDHVLQQQCADQFRQSVQDRLKRHIDTGTEPLDRYRPRRRGINSNDIST